MERFNWIKNSPKILNRGVKTQYSTSLRKYILNNKIFEYKCNCCNINSWNGLPITLEIEHKDGDTWNNIRENLELLYPNCHSQTSTYRKNRKGDGNIRKQITDQEIIEKLKSCNNINQLLIELNLSNSGGNYKRVHNIIKENNLESFYDIPKILKKDIKYKKSHRELLNERVEFIKLSKIDFSIRGWGIKLGKDLNLTPFAAISWIKKNLPEFYKDCFKHIN